jgi:hypothetical protein
LQHFLNSKTPSPSQSGGGLQPQPAENLLETPIIPIATTPVVGQFEIQTLRHDSTESEHSQQDAAFKLM